VKGDTFITDRMTFLRRRIPFVRRGITSEVDIIVRDTAKYGQARGCCRHLRAAQQ